MKKKFQKLTVITSTFAWMYLRNINYINLSLYYFTKINGLLASSRVEYCTANTFIKSWNEIVPGYVHEIFKLLLCRCNCTTLVNTEAEWYLPHKKDGLIQYLITPVL